MPSSTSILSYGSGSTPSVMPRGGLDASLILNRASASAHSTASTSALLGIGFGGFDSTLLSLELKRQERRRQLMKYSGRFDDEPKVINN